MKVQPQSNGDANLRLSLQSLQSQVSGLQLARRQAEDMTQLLMRKHLNGDLGEQVFQKIVQHMKQQDRERSTQLLGVLQVTLVALNDLAQKCVDASLKQELIEIIKSLTLTVETSNVQFSRG